jgi:hypothetical protein
MALNLTALVCLAVCLTLGGAALIPNKEYQGSVNGDNDWDYLLFVQRWPASVCVDGHVTGAVTAEKCSFPAEMAPNVSLDRAKNSFWFTSLQFNLAVMRNWFDTMIIFENGPSLSVCRYWTSSFA